MRSYRNINLILANFVLIFMIGTLNSCENGGQSDIPVIVTRGVSLVAWTIEDGSLGQRVRHEIEAVQQLELALYLSPTNEVPPNNLPVIARFELDFGEGNGWEDVTAEARNWDYGDKGRDLDVSRLTHHTYSKPGEYQLRGRVTYWDGEAVDTSGRPPNFTTRSDITITILPPEAAP
jgi:hypothetical protein